MKKTLQEQYSLIKEGKGHKDVFMKQAKATFPNQFRNAATFDEIVNGLKYKNVINENIVGLEPITSIPTSKKESYEVAFENFLKEAKEEEEKAELKKTSKQVEEDLSKNFDRTDKTNPDNLIFDQIMKGYYTEMCEPKNKDKTMGEIKSIVFKNLEKNPIYYTEKGQFGIKDLGYTTEHPGLGTPKEAKGKYKSSGYGDLKENKKPTPDNLYMISKAGSKSTPHYVLEKPDGSELVDMMFDTYEDAEAYAKKKGWEVKDGLNLNEDHKPGDIVIYKGTRYEVVEETETTITLKDKNGNIITKNYNQFKKGEYKGDVNESNLRKVIREIVNMELSEGGEDVDYYTSVIASNTMDEDTAYVWLEDQGVDPLTIDTIIAQSFPTNESLNEGVLRKIIRESVEKELALINKEAESEVISSKLEKIEAAIEKRQSQLNKLDEDEDMKALTDKKKIKQAQKDIKTLEKAKSKLEKQLSKVAKKNKDITPTEVIDEDEPIGEAIDDQKVDKVKTSLEDIDKTVDSISTKTKDMFEVENELPQEVINQIVKMYAEDGMEIDDIASNFPEMYEDVVEFLEGYDLGLDYDI